MELFVDCNSYESQIINLLGSYLPLESQKKIKIIEVSREFKNLQSKNVLNVPSTPFLVTESGLLTDLFEICLKLLDLAFCRPLFVEQNELQIKEIIKSCSEKQSEEFIKYFNDYLADKTFIISHHFTLADIIVFPYAYHQLVFMNSSQKYENCHLFRWLDHIQSISQVKQYLVNNSKQLVSMPDMQEVNKNKKKTK